MDQKNIIFPALSFRYIFFSLTAHLDNLFQLTPINLNNSVTEYKGIRVPKVPFHVFDKLKNEIQKLIIRF